MAAFKTYRFILHRTSPGELSFVRAVEYFEQIAKLVGNKDSIRMLPIEEGSFVCPFAVFEEAVPAVTHCLRQGLSQHSEGASRQLSKMLNEDKLTADVALPGGEILHVPVAATAAEPVRRVLEPVTLQGRLTRLEGGGEAVKIGLQTSGIQVSGITIAAGRAKELAQHFHAFVRLSGDGTLTRDGEGVWRIVSLHVQAFAALEDETADDVLRRLEGLIEPGEGKAVLSELQAHGNA